MIFSIRELTFDFGPLMLEGYLAFFARLVCALALFAAGWIVSLLLRKKVFPRLQGQTWRFASTPVVLRSFELPVEHMAWSTGLYLSLTSLPWAITGIPKFLLTIYQAFMTFYVCEGLYNSAEIADLLLSSCSEEIRSNRTLLSLLNTSYKVLIAVLGAAAIAQEFGLPIGSIVAGAGLMGLTISLAAKETASNLFSGIVILLDKPFSVGDWITVGDVEGEVIDINFRSTRIRSLDQTVNIVTNSEICAKTVKNATLRTMRPYKFNLGVTYDTTRPQIEKLMADILAMLEESPTTNKGTNIVRLVSFGDSSINIMVSAYLLTNSYAVFLRMQNDLNLNIMDIMNKDGVSFAFPSTSVYIEKTPS